MLYYSSIVVFWHGSIVVAVLVIFVEYFEFYYGIIILSYSDIVVLQYCSCVVL